MQEQLPQPAGERTDPLGTTQRPNLYRQPPPPHPRIRLAPVPSFHDISCDGQCVEVRKGKSPTPSVPGLSRSTLRACEVWINSWSRQPNETTVKIQARHLSLKEQDPRRRAVISVKNKTVAKATASQKVSPNDQQKWRDRQQKPLPFPFSFSFRLSSPIPKEISPTSLRLHLLPLSPSA